MIQYKSRISRLTKFHTLVFIFVALLLITYLQLIPKSIYAYESDQMENVLSEGGQICPLESQCDNKKDNQTDTHNMTLNVPGAGISNNQQDSIENSITNNSGSSQNKTGEAKNLSQEMLAIETDKQVYNPGEIVRIFITNKGSAEMTFPNSALGLTIRNLVSNELYPILSSQVITILGPGDSKSLRWDQMSVNGNQAPHGNYSASVKSDISTAETTFSIR